MWPWRVRMPTQNLAPKDVLARTKPTHPPFLLWFSAVECLSRTFVGHSQTRLLNRNTYVMFSGKLRSGIAHLRSQVEQPCAPRSPQPCLPTLKKVRFFNEIMPTLLRTCRRLCCTWQGSVQRICCLERKNDHLHMKKSNEQSKTPCAKLLIARLLLSLAFVSSERFSASTTGPVSLIWSGQNCKWYLIKFVYILFSKQASCPCPPSFQRTWWPGLGFCVQPDTTLVALCLYVLTPLYLAAHTLLKKYKFSQNAVNTVQIPAWLHSTVTGKPQTTALHFTLMGAPYSMELRPKMEKNLAILMVMVMMMKW